MGRVGGILIILPSGRAIGLFLVISGIVGILLYGWLVFLYSPLFTLEVTAFVGVASIFGIVGWIGYTMATTPEPESVSVDQPVEAQSTPEAKA
jgi:predicted DNA-binding transcriptional regulator